MLNRFRWLTRWSLPPCCANKAWFVGGGTCSVVGVSPGLDAPDGRDDHGDIESRNPGAAIRRGPSCLMIQRRRLPRAWQEILKHDFEGRWYFEASWEVCFESGIICICWTCVSHNPFYENTYKLFRMTICRSEHRIGSSKLIVIAYKLCSMWRFALLCSAYI